MSEQVRSGVLHWDPDRARLVIAEEGGEIRTVRKAQRDLAGDLKDREPADLDGVPVDFTWHSGQPRAIRRAGDPAPARQARRPDSPDPDAFHNPYTFVPAPPRDSTDPGLADSEHAGGVAGHHRLRPQLWTGTIAVNLTVETPLLLLDTSRREPVGDQGHFAYPVLLRDGVPHLAPTAVKGMLRSAYEAITNSRFGVLDKHADRLGYRMPPSEARRMVPARVSDDGSKLVLLPGDTPVGGQLEPNPVLHAAWLPRYLTSTSSNITYRGRLLPSHRQEADAIVELLQHYGGKKAVADFRVWRVRALAPAGSGQLPDISEVAPSPPEQRYVPVAGTPLKHIRGHVFVTNRNFGRKHDERIFFEGSEPAAEVALTKDLRGQWQETIRSYRDAHADREIHRVRNGQSVPPDRYCGKDPGETAWSPHQYDNRYLSLSAGDLCFALVDANAAIRGLYPVLISRSLHRVPPRALLHDSLLPAEDMSKLSPADRVFGWAHAAGSGAYRGQLRIGPVTCEQGPDSVHDGPEDFGEHGVPLAILGRPRPQQGRFYLAARQSRPQDGLGNGQLKDQWYREGQGLRGRKIYPHHAGLAEDYWNRPIEDRTQQLDGASRYQEYRQPRKGPDTGELTADQKAFLIPEWADEQRSDQNRSVRGWIRPGSTFRFTIGVENLTDVELGALAWLIRLPPGHFHRIGYGKPLGFGSVRLDAETSGTDLRRGAGWTARYRSLRSADAQDPGNAETIIDSAIRSFTQAAAGEKQAESVPHIAAFLAASRGSPGAPMHYPRARPDGMDMDIPVPPDPRGRSFSWFQLNEKEQHGKVVPGRGRSLPPPGGEKPLMTYPAEPSRTSGTSAPARNR